jgi:hypothetical protein
VSFFVAPSLRALFAEVDQMAPRRRRRSDGAVGDAAHQTRKSDHNPDRSAGGIVRAIDVTHDPAGGCDCNQIARRLRERRDPRVAYIIFNRRIMAGNDGPSPWVWRRYTGASPHTHHMHVSIRHTRGAERDRGTWLLEGFSIVDKETKEYLDEQFGLIRGRIDRAVQRIGGRSNTIYNSKNAHFQGLVMAEEALTKAEEARRLAKTAVDQLTAVKNHLQIP